MMLDEIEKESTIWFEAFVPSVIRDMVIGVVLKTNRCNSPRHQAATSSHVDGDGLCDLLACVHKATHTFFKK